MDNEERDNLIFERQKELITHSMSNAMAYTNLVIVGGYASFFGLWSLTKEHLLKEQIFWSASFIFLSVVSFVLFEIYKMYINGKIFVSLTQTVIDSIQFPQKILEHKEKSAEIARGLGKIGLLRCHSQ